MILTKDCTISDCLPSAQHGHVGINICGQLTLFLELICHLIRRVHGCMLPAIHPPSR